MSCAKNQVLIVEDDQDMLEIMVEVLKDEYEVTQAFNGEEALKLLSACEPNHLPGLIILDTVMPVMDGNEFLNCVRTQYPERFAHIPVLLSSANGHRDLDSFAPLKVSLLSKPMDMHQLISAVENAFRATHFQG